jgi:hypothetical protein
VLIYLIHQANSLFDSSRGGLMKKIERQPLVFTKEVFESCGKQYEVLAVRSGLEHLDMSDDKCCLCGLKIRNGGKHSYLVHKLNGGFDYAQTTLLRCDIQELWDDMSVSQGGSGIGAECRKKLPAEFTLKISDFDNQ